MNLQRIKNAMSMSNSNRGSSSRKRPKANQQDPTECNVFCSDMVGLDFIERKLHEVGRSKQVTKLELEDLLDEGQQHLKILPQLKSLLLSPGRKWESVRFVDTFALDHYEKWHSTKGSILEDYQYQDTALVGWKKLMEFRASIEISSGTPVEEILQLFQAAKQDPHVVSIELRLDMLSGKRGTPEEMMDLIHWASTTGTEGEDESKEGTITKTIFVDIDCGHCETGYTKKQMDLKLLLSKSIFLLKCAGLEVASAPLNSSNTGTGAGTETTKSATTTSTNARAARASVASMRVPRRQPADVPSMDMSLRGSQSRSRRKLGKSTSFDVLSGSCTKLRSSSLHAKTSPTAVSQWNVNSAVASIPERRAAGPANRLATSNRKPPGRTKSASLVRPRMTSVNGMPVSASMSSSDTIPPRHRMSSTTSQSQGRTISPQRKLPSRSRSDLSEMPRSTGIIKKSSSDGNLDLLGADSDDEDADGVPTESPAMMQRRARRRLPPSASQSTGTMKKSSSTGNLDLLGGDSDGEDDAQTESPSMMQRRAIRRLPPAAFSEVSQLKTNSSNTAAPPRRKLPARSKSDLSEMPRISGAAQKRESSPLKVRAQKRASSPPLPRVYPLNNDAGDMSTDSPTTSNGRRTRTRPATVTPELSPRQRKSETTANPQRKLPLRTRSDLGIREKTTPKRTVSDKSAFQKLVANDDSMAATATTRTSLASVMNRQPEAGIKVKQRKASLSPKRQGSSSPKKQEPSFDISTSNLDLEVLLAAKRRLDAAIAQKQRDQGDLPDYDWGAHNVSLSSISTTQAFRPTNPNA